ncbi:MAG: type II toxin-antitoxin system RelE/ParE family toxin [Bryobacteraceae bacterium]|nr:type II toxin-antitoxin system RelE/ParE family toxin [Bryobacteraceae bacterium]
MTGNPAIRILQALTRYSETGEGDIRPLTGEGYGYSRLRVGEYRVILNAGSQEITILRIRHRSDVYR